MKKSIKLNYIYNLSYQILILITPLITTPYISRVLGPNAIGLYSFTQSVTTYFILFGCIGLNLYGQRQIAYVQDDIILRSQCFFELIILRFISLPISIIIFTFTMILPNTEYSLLFLIQIIDLLASLIDISWFYQGLENFGKITFRNFLTKLLGILLIFLFVKTESDIYIYALCYSVPLFLGNILLWIDLKKYILINFEKINLKKHVWPVLMMFLPQIATSVYTVLDKTMIGLLTQLNKEVGYYEQAQKIIRVVMAIVTSLGTVMLPRIASLYMKNDLIKIRYYMNNSYKFVLFTGMPIMFGLIAITPDFVPWFFGDAFLKVIPNLIIISPIVIFIGLSGITGTQYLLSLNKQKEYTLSVLIGMFVNIVLNLIFIPNFYSIGAAFSTVLAEASVTIFQLFVVRNTLDVQYVLKELVCYFFKAGIMGILVYLFSMKLSPSIISTIIEILFGGVIYVLILFITKDNIIFLIKNKIFLAIKRGV